MFFSLYPKKKLDKNVIVSLNLMLPFVAYLIAEELHVSGVRDWDCPFWLNYRKLINKHS
jgi:hypothetical protein